MFTILLGWYVFKFILLALIIADGAAIGAEMNQLSELMSHNPHLHCFLPESFEWLILKSGLIDGDRVQTILSHPEEYIDSKDYFSWEQYFTKLLISETADHYLHYQKKKLNPNYLHEKEKNSILSVIKGIEFFTAEEN